MLLTEKSRKWWILAAMTTTISMIFVDITVLPVILPTLQREMNLSDLGMQWIINIYTLFLTVFVLAGGKIGDMWGLKKAFCFGVITFAVASGLCGLAHSAEFLIAARALQGIGGAFLLPATQGIIISHFPPHQRGKAMGLFVSIGSIFLTLGPLIGGGLTTYLSWRYVFWINFPIAAIGLLLTLYAVPHMPGKKERFDFKGFSIIAVGIASLIFALMQSEKWGWSSPATLLLIALGLFCIAYLFFRKTNPESSILDFEVMRKRSFITSSSCVFLNQLIVMVNVFWVIYFQNILGFSPYTAGLYAFLANLPVLFAASLGGFLVDRVGPRIPIVSGFALICFSLVWFSTFADRLDIALLMPTLLTFGFGVSMIYTPSFVTLMHDVPPEKRGVVSGITGTLRQFSSSLGLALFAAIYSSIYHGQLHAFLQKRASTAHLQEDLLQGILSHTPSAIEAVNRLGTQDAGYVLVSAKTAFLSAFTMMNLTGAFLALLGMGMGFYMVKKK